MRRAIGVRTEQDDSVWLKSLRDLPGKAADRREGNVRRCVSIRLERANRGMGVPGHRVIVLNIGILLWIFPSPLRCRCLHNGSMNPEDFLVLLRRAKAGENSAIDQLLAEFLPYLEGLARPYADPGRADESVSDLVQDATMRVWQRLGQFNGAETAVEALPRFRDWLQEVVRSVGLNHRRDGNRDKRRPPSPLIAVGPADSDVGRGAVDPPDSAASPSSLARGKERQEQVRDAVGSIPDEKDHEVTRLFFLKELKLHEIVRCLGLTYDQARECLHRGKEWLARTKVRPRSPLMRAWRREWMVWVELRRQNGPEEGVSRGKAKREEPRIRQVRADRPLA